MGVAVGGLHFHHARADFQHGNVEGAAAQVIHRNGLVALLIQTVRQRRRGRLINDAHHFQTGDFAGLLGGLPLRVVKIRRDGDHRLGHLLAEKIFRRGLQLAEDHGGNLRRTVSLARNLHSRVLMRSGNHLVGHATRLFANFIVAPAHEPLDGVHRVFWIGHRLALGHLPDQPLTGFGDSHDGRRRPRTLLVGDDHWLAALHHRHDRVGCSQVNSNNLAHCYHSS